ncbi:hypothetical protein ACTI_33620 [Actinoplanes sp. OR16]|uniref:hypothetical protein n=1 Tax=Actinoplanes sp. OR16 TaxID=946334 RepID=UPI000F6D2519|nr:hypothetical protein [Actinoplanes sp. OR16]BBH66677.1 hypothetical protein ACTI_33620 [Actinoplanes sp. OR16]
MTSSPLVAESHDSTRWHTGLGLVGDVADITEGIRNDSWVDPILGGVGASLDLLTLTIDPLGGLMAWGVAWLMEHVQPLKEALDHLAGNADEVTAHAATWSNISSHTDQTAQQYANSMPTDWAGAAADAYQARARTHLNNLSTLATATRGISYAVEGAGLLVALVRGIVRDLIAEFVATLAVRLPQWLAMEGLTLGIATPAVAAQVSALVLKWSNRIQHFIRGLLNSLRHLTTKLTDLTSRLTRSDPEPPRLRHSDADPLARWGPARQTHPEQWDAAIREAEEAGVEVIFRSGGLAYGPSPAPGRPGEMILDPDASYGALLHEMQHLRDDRDVGWAGMRGWFTDPEVRYAGEARAYDREIRYAESIGDHDSVAKLKELLAEEYRRIFEETP